MDEYIEREAALSFPFANGQYDNENADPHFINGCETYREWLETIPAADVAPVVHGRWKLLTDGSGVCSECGFTQKDVWDMDGWQNFCGHCGAKMDEEANDG